MVQVAAYLAQINYSKSIQQMEVQKEDYHWMERLLVVDSMQQQ